MENEFSEYSFIEKHSYPYWVRVLLVSITLIFISVIPSFLLKELPKHYALNDQILKAKDAFVSQNYKAALDDYLNLLSAYPSFKKARIKAIKCYFALGYFDRTNIKKGLKLLGNEAYSEYEVHKMAMFLPAECREIFKGLFKFKKSRNVFATNP